MKVARQAKILELIVKNEIGTQEELTARLEEAGFNATQATVSRDIREMKLTKVADAAGKLRYVAFKTTEDDMNEKYIRIFLDGFLSMDNAGNILVIKTVSGMAMAVAAALDHMDLPEIVGSIAGDDTIMCAVRTLDDTIALMGKLKKLIEKR
ncbi:arginine repressor [Pseudobutyrivibrio sp. MD2005]|uniref:arginine repressor n=1 Tax=Pseudobutyrivibrio sp. MD2005 TaxID=1410616 RepID=UPI000481D6A2|nr:arginine repressor [Pseudobutyrivibrio sp. MD2005]